MTEFELKCYGMSQDDIRSNIINSITTKMAGIEMTVMGILSDCQEMISMKNPSIPSPESDEYIRKQLNIAKFILADQLQTKMKAA
jgi:hypothetical protein